MPFSRKLSETTFELVSNLWAERNSFFGLLRRRSSLVTLVQEIGYAGEPPAIPVLLDLVFDRDFRVAQAARDSVDALIQYLPVDETSWFDQHVRAFSPYRGPWRSLTPSWLESGQHPETLLLLAALHPSGYVRETALHVLPLSRTGRELPFVIIRLNDWVEAVRSAAREAFLSRLKPETCQIVVQCLPLLRNLEQTSRANHSEVISRTREVFGSRRGLSALLEGLGSQEKSVRRACFHLGATLPVGSVGVLLSSARSSFDPTIRLRAARQTKETLDANRAKATVDSLLQDRFAPVRIVALDIARQHLQGDARAILESCLTDLSSAVRWYAQFYLRSQHSVDPACEYRKAIVSDERRTLVASIHGLGETGDRDDLQLVVSYLESRYPSVRAASVRSIASLGSIDQNEHIVRALRDPAPSVAREAIRALRTIGVSLTVPDVEQIFNEIQSHQSRHVLLELVENMGRWSRPLIVIPACLDEDEKTSERASALFSQWLTDSNRVGIQPTPKDLDRLRTSADRYGAGLTNKQATELGFLIKVFSN